LSRFAGLWTLKVYTATLSSVPMLKSSLICVLALGVLSSAASVSVDGKKLFASVNEDRDFVFCSSTLSVSETARDAVRTATGNEKIEVSAVMSHVFCFVFF
jgi:hypothetical protein